MVPSPHLFRRLQEKTLGGNGLVRIDEGHWFPGIQQGLIGGKFFILPTDQSPVPYLRQDVELRKSKSLFVEPAGYFVVTVVDRRTPLHIRFLPETDLEAKSGDGKSIHGPVDRRSHMQPSWCNVPSRLDLIVAAGHWPICTLCRGQ